VRVPMWCDNCAADLAAGEGECGFVWGEWVRVCSRSCWLRLWVVWCPAARVSRRERVHQSVRESVRAAFAAALVLLWLHMATGPWL
jgi:hypothetical protein